MAKRKKKGKARKRKRRALLPSAKLDLFLAYMRGGHHLSVACKLSGVEERTVYKWLEQSERDVEAGDEESPCVQFGQSLAQAEATAEEDALDVVRRSFDHTEEGVTEREELDKDGCTHELKTVRTTRKFSPDIAIRFLERRHPKRWGLKQEIEHSGEVAVKRYFMEGGDPLDVPVPGMDEPEADT